MTCFFLIRSQQNWNFLFLSQSINSSSFFVTSQRQFHSYTPDRIGAMRFFPFLHSCLFLLLFSFSFCANGKLYSAFPVITRHTRTRKEQTTICMHNLKSTCFLYDFELWRVLCWYTDCQLIYHFHETTMTLQCQNI